MIDTLVARAKGFLQSPVETFRQSKNDEPLAVFMYFGALLVFNAIISAGIAALGMATMPMNGMSYGLAFPVRIFFMMLVGGFIVMLVFAAWLHLWVYIFGGRKGIMQTANALIYGSTPSLLLGWIPIIGFIFTLWSVVICILGIRELHEVSSMKATLAVAIAVMIPVILLLVLAAYLMISYVTMTAGPVTPVNLF
ncbi:MAG: YIP1 family protein [Methanoregula sp.]|jgi:hypothetical protein|nr:YIP1 family protein [Methanoregula sp.]